MVKIIGLLLACFLAGQVAKAAETRFMVDQDPARIEVLADGAGPVIMFLPSLGRGADDYAEAAATTATPLDLWFAGGSTKILDLQAEGDTVAPRKFAGVLKAALGDRVTAVVIQHAAHALNPEQPRAVAQAVAAFARGL